MPGNTPLITTIIAGLCLAFVFGFIANRLKTSPLIGYILAGIIVGPYTGGFHADPELTQQLAEIGVILLMFGVGLHFSLKDLLSVKFIAIPGAIAQMAIATALGGSLSWLLGGHLMSNIVFGLSLSTASTVVLLRNMQGLNLLETERGRIAIGWLIVEDLAMVITLVLVPALVHNLEPATKGLSSLEQIQSQTPLAIVVFTTIAKMFLFIAIMLIFGKRIIPWILKITAQSGSKELFRLSVLAIALGVAAGSAYLFGVSLALGAFFAGMMMSESDFSQRAAEESLPLRDAFAVLFFVSVGMLFNPLAIWKSFFALLATLSIIIFGKSLIAYFIVRLAKKSIGTALTIAASLAQIGEFSFILVSLGASLNLFEDKMRDILLGSAILSILINPFLFMFIDNLRNWLEKRINPDKALSPDNQEDAEVPLPHFDLENHFILINYNFITAKIIDFLNEYAHETIVIDDISRIPNQITQKNVHILRGNANALEVLQAANISKAKKIALLADNIFEAEKIILQARKICPDIEIIAYSQTESDTKYLLNLKVNHVIQNDEKIAKAMLYFLLNSDKTIKSPSIEHMQYLTKVKNEI